LKRKRRFLQVKNPLVGDGKAGLPKDLKDLALFNILHKEEEMSVFGQERFEDALKLKLDKATYEEVHSKMVRILSFFLCFELLFHTTNVQRFLLIFVLSLSWQIIVVVHSYRTHVLMRPFSSSLRSKSAGPKALTRP
jgi:hypothetical protein